MTVFELLQSALDASTLRQAVYANNIANAGTPGYKRQDVAFETLLQSALGSGDSNALGEAQIPIGAQRPSYDLSALPNVIPEVYTDTSTTVNSNGNNVDITEEMVLMAENQVRYDTLAQDISDRLVRLRTAIMGS